MGISSNCILKWACSLEKEKKKKSQDMILFCGDEMTSQHLETSPTYYVVLNGKLILISC